MALAGLDERVASQAIPWRSVAKHAYYLALGGASAALLYFDHPHFDHTPRTLIGVAVVAAFLIFVERPHRATGAVIAPMTSVLALSTVVFGYWALVIACVAWCTVFVRREERSIIQALTSTALLGQMSASILSIYAMIAIWSGAVWLTTIAPAPLTVPIELMGVLAVGLMAQSTINVLVAVACAIVGTQFKFGLLWRTGILASVWAYFLIAIYSFGGILATAIFYIVVAESRMLSGVMGVIEAVDKNERSQGQAYELLGALMTFTDSAQVEFTREVSYMTTLLGRHLNLAKKDLETLKLAAELHEIGLCRVPAGVRNSAGLTPAQAQVRARYPYLGGQLLRRADALIPFEVSETVELHREHFDGTGYPRGLKGNRIPVAARIVSIASDYIRLLTGYGGTNPVPKTQALEHMRSSAGSVYDPALVDLLSRVVA